MHIPFSLIPNAAVDLKDMTFRIKDGYSATGAVNNALGYAQGATTMTVDGFTTSLADGETFDIEGQDTEYTITSATDTLGATTSITFTPGLTAGVSDDDVITVLPHKVEIKIGEGNLTFSEKTPRTYIKDRGVLDTVKDADEEPMEVNFDFVWEFLKSDTGEPPTVREALYREGNASSWTSSSDDACEPYCVDIEIFYDPPCSDDPNERILLEEFRQESLDYDARNSSVACSGKCNKKRATVTRTGDSF